MPSLFDPLVAGDLTLPNRILMAPLTRVRAGPSMIPNDLMVEYYRQRAGAGLILSEGVPISPMAVGYTGVPGNWLPEHVAGWKRVTQAVHAEGGRIFMQIWHVGRVSDPAFLDGRLPEAPSAIAPEGHVSLLRPKKPFVTPHAMTIAEVKQVVSDFGRAAQLAQDAGFDGVELHGANGYLLDQFLQDGSNHRTDEYGGSIENRARLHLEAADAAIAVWGAGRVAMHIAPRRDGHSMGDSTPLETFGYLAEQLGKRKIAFLCAREHEGPDSLGPQLKQRFGGVYVANENFTLQSAQAALNAGWADAVAFGKAYIANPDLAERFRTNAPLNEPDPTTFYSEGAHGYTDYPALG